MYPHCKTRFAFSAAALLLLSNLGVAQTGAIPADLKGVVLDLSSYPPGKPVSLSESFDLGSGKGLYVAFDLEYGNLGFFSNDPASRFFSLYPMPSAAGTVNSVSYPANNYWFFSSLNDLGDGTGVVTGANFTPGGLLSLEGGSAATRNILYGGALDNTLWFDRTVNTCPDEGVCNPTDTVAPLHSWADLSGGESHGCAALAPGRAPKGRFIVITKRFGCDWAERVTNVAASGAIAWIIYDDEEGDHVGPLATPKTPLPVVIIRARDGAAILAQLKAGGGSVNATLHPLNINTTVSGTYRVGSDGKLQAVNLNLVVSTQIDTIFTATLTTPQGAVNLKSATPLVYDAKAGPLVHQASPGRSPSRATLGPHRSHSLP